MESKIKEAFRSVSVQLGASVHCIKFQRSNRNIQLDLLYYAVIPNRFSYSDDTATPERNSDVLF